MKKKEKRVGRAASANVGASRPRRAAKPLPGSTQGGASAATSLRSNANRRDHLDWKPLHDLKMRAPVADHKGMSIEERKAAQLEKWKKELGLT